MRQALKEQLRRGMKLSELLDKLDGLSSPEGTVIANVDTRARPYLQHDIVEWTDGPPSSNVIAFISGKDPAKARWRRFTLTHTGSWRCEIDAFPTPFNNAEAPLAPGIPPGASRIG